jgi:hypothetical protein
MRVLMLLVLIFVGGCVGVVPLESSGGSKADGIVEFSHTYGVLRRPDGPVITDQVIQEATEICAGWGYADARSLKGKTQECFDKNENGCMSYTYTYKFQCIDRPEGL